MNEYQACEQAYRNGYAQGLKDRGEKTADEMFREQGYEKAGTFSGRNGIQYISKNDEFGIAHRITILKGYGAFASVELIGDPDSANPCDFLQNEIRAVCKLLDEMEVE